MLKPMSVRLDEQLAGQLTTLATLTDRPKTWLVEQALRDYIAREMQFLDAVEEGIRAEAAGELVEHAEAVAEIDRIIAAARQA